MLIEFHLIQNHAPSNLNRDDTGSPKECTFGGHRRARISSQCLKRSIRRSALFQDEINEEDRAIRTRRLPEIVASRMADAGLPEDVCRVAARKVTGFGHGEGKETDANKKTGQFETRQTMFLTQRDIDAVTGVVLKAAQAAGSAKKLEAVKAKDLQESAELQGFRPITVDVALFGRMVTSAAFRDVESSCQVAHALSTHKVAQEFDYFTAVDDLQDRLAEKEEDAGADMIGDVEFNSACYYKYFSIDVQGLVDNLTGVRSFKREVPDEERQAALRNAAAAIGCMLEAAALVTPTGKQNTFAAHQLPSLILVEARPKRTPVSYANAFVDPAAPSAKGGLVTASLAQFRDHVQAVHAAFELESEPRLLFTPEHNDLQIAGTERVPSLKALRRRLEDVVSHA